MGPSQYQGVIKGGSDDVMAEKRRMIYLRPFILFYLNTLFAEVIFLAVAILVMSGTRDLLTKVLWTLVFCPLGMGGALGGLINFFVVDYHYGKRAIHFTAILTLLVLGSCNYLCFSLDHYFGFFGAVDHPWWFQSRYPVFYIAGYMNGKLLFTDEGQDRLAKLGL